MSSSTRLRTTGGKSSGRQRLRLGLGFHCHGDILWWDTSSIEQKFDPVPVFGAAGSVVTDYLDYPIERRWALLGLRIYELACNFISICRVTPGQSDFKLPGGFKVPKALLRYVVMQPPNREAFVRGAEASPKHIVQCVETM